MQTSERRFPILIFAEESSLPLTFVVVVTRQTGFYGFSRLFFKSFSDQSLDIQPKGSLASRASLASYFALGYCCRETLGKGNRALVSKYLESSLSRTQTVLFSFCPSHHRRREMKNKVFITKIASIPAALHALCLLWCGREFYLSVCPFVYSLFNL